MNAEKVTKCITNWLNNYATTIRSKGFVIGISGGIDSALTSTLCAKTKLPTLCVEMPIHQSPKQVNRAQRHIKWLKNKYANVQSTSVDLTKVFDDLITAFPDVSSEEHRLMALVNTRARLRMTTLYYFAGLNGYLVAGTGNKVEDFGIGFFTKYGDGGVDLSPIADLTKTEVYELASYLEVGSDIIKAAPTDGLWGDNRTDEDQIGASYPELEWAMTKKQEGKTELDFKGRELIVFQIFDTLNKANQHKIQPIPVCKIPNELK